MTQNKTRYMVHVDMDAFFASCEQHNNPTYMNKPVIVGADPQGGVGRGVVAACSYEAREFGIHSALPISIAYKKCPQAIFLVPNMQEYARVSHEIFDILETFTPEVEPISIDEAFLDITGSHHLFGSPEETCQLIKQTIKEKTGLTASIGLAPNMMTAKIASDLEKPDGFVVVTQKNLLPFLHKLPIGKLWGIGKKSQEAFKNMSIHTIGDIAKSNVHLLEKYFGKGGVHLWELSHGIDERQVETEGETKSISNEYTFEKDTKNDEAINDTLMFLSEKVSRRLYKSDFKGRTITLKIRFSDFKTYTRSITIDTPTNFADDIYKNICEKRKEFDLNNTAVRLLGVKVSNLIDLSNEYSLFDETPNQDQKKERLHKALNRIIDKFGEGSVRRRY